MTKESNFNIQKEMRLCKYLSRMFEIISHQFKLQMKSFSHTCFLSKKVQVILMRSRMYVITFDV